MQKINEADLANFQKELETHDFKIVDVSHYPTTRRCPDQPFEMIVLVAHQDGKALILEVVTGSSGIRFRLCGQTGPDSAYGNLFSDEVKYFPKVKRRATGSEGYTIDTFEINHWASNSGQFPGRNEFSEGLAFIQSFLEEYRHLLALSFTKSLHLFPVPEHSDDWEDRQGKASCYHRKYYEYYKEKITSKLPVGYYPER